MRVGVKSMLLLIAGYAVLITAFALGIDRWLHGFEGAVTLETSHLLAREEAALLSERTLGALAAPDGTSRTLLRERIQDLTLLSEVVSSITAVAGLAGVFLLGGILQCQISRQAARIAATLEDAIQPPTERPDRLLHGDEFSRVLRAAGRVRQALSAARQETSRLQEGFSALAQAMRMGVLLLRGDREPDFANPRALELLGFPSLDELKARWPTIRDAIESELGRRDPGAESAPAVHIELPGPGVPKLRVEMYRLGDEDHAQHLVLLNDPQILDSP